jgi:hypothetical protein
MRILCDQHVDHKYVHAVDGLSFTPVKDIPELVEDLSPLLE